MVVSCLPYLSNKGKGGTNTYIKSQAWLCRLGGCSCQGCLAEITSGIHGNQYLLLCNTGYMLLHVVFLGGQMENELIVGEISFTNLSLMDH